MNFRFQFLLFALHMLLGAESVSIKRLNSIEVLHFRKDELIAGKKPIQQLTCVDDLRLCYLYAPDYVSLKVLNQNF